ncbi:hypothetical protein [Dactylosporangium sp. CA-092794]|uniref:hypothetical protein n=1 Tax=Dactylosporangium sp. CA-092794 TaxID=3239929 RepID=UPI003D8B3FB7
MSTDRPAQRRAWRSALLSAPDGARAGVPGAALAALAALTRRLRDADPHGHWRFRRLDGAATPRLEVSVWSTPPVADELLHRLGLDAARHGWSVHPPAPAGEPGSGAGDDDLLPRLAAASSDFAVEVAAHPLTADEQFGLAVVHLRRLYDFLAPEHHLPLLFHGWHHWSRSLTPPDRVRLAATADRHAEGPLSGQVREPWQSALQRYAQRVGAALQGHRDGAHGPLPYLLFDLAHATHDRLGLAPAVGAAAARALRGSLVAARSAAPAEALVAAA